MAAGFSRTGTASLKAEPKTLGSKDPCYHTSEVFVHPEHASFWFSARRGEPVGREGVLGAYSAVVDWPTCAFYAELAKRHPDAKVVLSVRAPERWYESTRNTIYGLSKVPSRSSPLVRRSS